MGSLHCRLSMVRHCMISTRYSARTERNRFTLPGTSGSKG